MRKSGVDEAESLVVLTEPATGDSSKYTPTVGSPAAVTPRRMTRRLPGPLSTMRRLGVLRVRSVKLVLPARWRVSPVTAEMASGVSCKRVSRFSAVTTISPSEACWAWAG